MHGSSSPPPFIVLKKSTVNKVSNFCFRPKTQKFDSIIRPRFKQKFKLIGKVTEVLFYNKIAVQYNYVALKV